MPGISDAVAESYASARRDILVWQTVELRHIAFEVPVRIVRGRRTALVATLEANAPLNAGEAVTFEPCAFEFIPPGVDDRGQPTSAKAMIDGVSGALVSKLDLTLETDRAVEVTFRAFASTETSSPGDIIGNLFLTDVELSSTTATADLRYREVATQGFPLRVFDKNLFPALFVQA